MKTGTLAALGAIRIERSVFTVLNGRTEEVEGDV